MHGLCGNSFAFKQNNGLSRPSHPIGTPDSKKILLIACCPPAPRGLLLGNRRVEGLTGGVSTALLGGERTSEVSVLGGQAQEADTVGASRRSEAE